MKNHRQPRIITWTTKLPLQTTTTSINITYNSVSGSQIRHGLFWQYFNILILSVNIKCEHLTRQHLVHERWTLFCYHIRYIMIEYLMCPHFMDATMNTIWTSSENSQIKLLREHLNTIQYGCGQRFHFILFPKQYCNELFYIEHS